MRVIKSEVDEQAMSLLTHKRVCYIELSSKTKHIVQHIEIIDRICQIRYISFVVLGAT